MKEQQGQLVSGDPPPKNEPRKISIGIRAKLIILFVLIKVIPLVLLALFATRQIDMMGVTVKKEYSEMAAETEKLVSRTGDLATQNSIAALDTKARETIERLTTDTAKAVASFLYQRDDDILLAAGLTPDTAAYKNFLVNRKKEVIYHRPWKLNKDGSAWIKPPQDAGAYPSVTPQVEDNKKDFHSRPPEQPGIPVMKPLYLEMTFIDLNGMEKVKVTTSDILSFRIRDISHKENTWCKAETYFTELRKLRPGEIYVSEMIGPYLTSPVIGPYTKKKAAAMGVSFEPQKAAYAGKENPVGRRFQGLIRWATPVVRKGKIIGYVTLALDHTHIMEFTDHIVPTRERYSPISDASSGNYAFMWDYKGRNISHPRDYFITGYDPKTGKAVVPWLSEDLYEQWQKTGLTFSEFEKIAPRYQNQSLKKKPASELTRTGHFGLDCRFLNFAPQCTDWNNLTQYGGSGSFVIFWSGLWKLTTAATIPYYTGIYKNSARGFGYVTIGANVHEFHSAANETAETIISLKNQYQKNLAQKERKTKELLSQLLFRTNRNLTVSTLVMIVLVIMIAVWIASTLTGKIVEMIKGIKMFQEGDLQHRLAIESKDEIGQLACAFNDMSDAIQNSIQEINSARKKAEESDRAKGIFLANMSHEIRTPMNAIIGMSRMALMSCQDEKQRQLIDSVRISADALLSLINDILDFSKIQAKQLDLEIHPFNLHELIRSIIQSVTVLARDKDLVVKSTISKGVPVDVEGDSLRLRQILLNLLSNAVKFTDQGTVSLDVDLAESMAKEVRLVFTVKDSGVGIDRENYEYIFNSFSQVDSGMSRKHQGTGLGLAISRNLCLLMKGDISVESEKGKGSVFRFSVTVRLAKKNDASNSLLERSENSQITPRMRILIVEDNETNRDLAQMILEGAGHHVQMAANGRAALEMLSEEVFDVVLMDIQMPEMDGFTATSVIRQMEHGYLVSETLHPDILGKLQEKLRYGHLPIVALTAHAMSGDREKCLTAGMDDYLTKPFIPEQMMNVLKKIARSFPDHPSTM